MSLSFRPHEILREVVLIEPAVARNERGWLFEGWRASEFGKAGLGVEFRQDSHVASRLHVLRGLHVKNESKLIRCIEGEVFDVAADVRTGSPTFGGWAGFRLSADNHQMVFIPPGFAHGLLALTDNAQVLIKRSTEFGEGGAETGVRWDDPTLAIEWPVAAPVVAEKDAKLPLLK